VSADNPYEPPHAPVIQAASVRSRGSLGRIAGKNIVVVVGALLPLLAIDYLSLRAGWDKDSVGMSVLRWLSVPAILVAPVGFFWANFRLLGLAPKVGQLVALAVFATLAGLVWLWLVALTVVGNFHLALGGRF